jgi:hypothetical protein
LRKHWSRTITVRAFAFYFFVILAVISSEHGSSNSLRPRLPEQAHVGYHRLVLAFEAASASPEHQIAAQSKWGDQGAAGDMG